MPVKPAIPMSPEALPQQTVYLVPPAPRVPEHWAVDFANQGPAFPARMPGSARYVAQVECAWSPMHSRIDAYHLSLNRRRDRWLLWLSFFDDEVWRFTGTHIAASGPRACLSATDAAVLLLQAYWTREAQGDMELDAPHWINQDGLLDVPRLKEIERRVWGANDADPADDAA